MKVFVKEFKVPERFGKNLYVYSYLIVQAKDGTRHEYVNVAGFSYMLNNNPFEAALLIEFENFWE